MSNGQYVLSGRLVEAIHQSLGGFHPGFRAVHARGRVYAGTFTASPEARALTRASHMQGEPVRATVRFSFGSGDPAAPPGKILGMATKFYLNDDTVTDLIALNLPQFPARSPEEVIALLEAMRPGEDGAPNQSRVRAFLQSRPAAAMIFQSVMAMQAPFSLAQTAFSAYHAFCFINARNERVYGRYHWAPEAGIAGQSEAELRERDPDHLFAELEERLRTAPVRYDLVFQLAQDGDPLDDPSAPWPNDRARVTLGQLHVTAPTTPGATGDRILMHDPTRVTDGIACSNDPILAARRGSYEVSVAERASAPHIAP